MTRRWPIAVPLPLVGLTAVLVTYQGWSSAMVGAVVAVTGTVAVLILRRHPTHRIGWLLALHSCLVSVIAPGGSVDSRWELAMGQLMQGSWVLMLVCPVVITYLFPDGHALSRLWRAWITVFLATYAMFLVAAASDRGGFTKAFPGHKPPLLTLGQPLAGILGVASLAFVPASLVGAVICARQRYLRSTGDERLRMLWFTLTALSLPAMMGILWTAYVAGADSEALFYPGAGSRAERDPGRHRHRDLAVGVVRHRAGPEPGSDLQHADDRRGRGVRAAPGGHRTSVRQPVDRRAARRRGRGRCRAPGARMAEAADRAAGLRLPIRASRGAADARRPGGPGRPAPATRSRVRRSFIAAHGWATSPSRCPRDVSSPPPMPHCSPTSQDMQRSWCVPIGSPPS